MTSTDIPATRQQRTILDYLGLTVRGFFMGAADIVPGVSGGTMALILGIYEELIDSIKAVDTKLVNLVLRLRVREALDSFPWKFLLAVGTGIGLAILSLAQFLETQLETNPSQVWAFFFGLVLASVVTVARTVERWSAVTILSALVALVGGYLLVGAVPAQTPDVWWFFMLSGALAICAMILPGISGAFILVLLGKYADVLAAVNDRDILTIALVGIGAAIGIVTFARLLSWLFKHYRDATLAFLTGLMLGSLRKIWPWQETISTTVDRHGEIVPLERINVLPSAFDGEVALTIGLSVVGLLFVLTITWIAGRNPKTAETH